MDPISLSISALVSGILAGVTKSAQHAVHATYPDLRATRPPLQRRGGRAAARGDRQGAKVMDRQVGSLLDIRERLRLDVTEVDGVYAYIGNALVVPGDGIDYAPDTFFLELRDDGWRFTEVCDEEVRGAVE